MKKTAAALLLLAILITALPMAALAEKYSISFAGKIGYMYEGTSVTIRPKLKGIKSEWLTWNSSNPGSALVDGGTVNALSAGLSVITASCGSKSASFGVVVLPRQINIEGGDTYQLPYGTVETYAVQNPSVATVTRGGLITACANGSTLIRVKAKKQTMYVEVNVFGAEGSGEADSRAAFLPCASQTSQIVLVEYEGGTKAKLSIHEKINGVWTEGYSCNAFVGRNGIGKTREGDGKTPTGTFNLTTPFGIKSDPGSAMPYTKVTKYHYWCGSSGSDYYNQLIDTRVISRSCTSSDENLSTYGSVYNYCMFIDYNAAGVAGKGSCIFLHCKGSSNSTAGCVAVPEAVMKKIIAWARPGCKIVIQ